MENFIFCAMCGMTVCLKLVKITWCLLFSVKNWIKRFYGDGFFGFGLFPIGSVLDDSIYHYYKVM